jgi:hypothetical protein
VDHLLVRPASEEDVVVIDGTDALEGLVWSESASTEGVMTAPLPSGTLRPDLIVGGYAIQCAAEDAIADPPHDDKVGWATASPPCFLWDPFEGWVANGGPFSKDDAEAYFEEGSMEWGAEARLPWMWIDAGEGVLHVDVERAPGGILPVSVVKKNAERADLFLIQEESHR